MAKDVIKRKQRIAHNKTNEGHEMYSESNDFLSSIMQDMDNNDLTAAMCTSKFQTNLPETSKHTFHEKTQSNLNQIPTRNHAALPKLQKLGLTRKGPLMQKTQKIMQNLQHNRKVAKPRAHLAVLSNSQSLDNSATSEKSKTKDINYAESTSKFQNKKATEKQVCNRIPTDKNKMKNSTEEFKSIEMTAKLKPVRKKICPAKESSYTEESIPKRHDAAIVKKNSEKSSHTVNNCDKMADNSSDSDEYEKFIQNEKKYLAKKSKQKMNNNQKSQKSLKKVIKNCSSKSVSIETESFLIDEESSNSYKSKKRKTHNMQEDEQSTNSLRNKIPKRVSRKLVSKSVSTESESDLTDEELSNSYKSKKMRKTHKMKDDRKSPISIKDKVSRKCKSRTVLKCASPSSDSEMSDGPSTSYKKRKKIHKKLNNKSPVTSQEDSESQMDGCDETYHNSSDSDDLPAPSDLMHGLSSTINKFSGQVDNPYESELSLHSNKAYNIPSMVSRDESDILCSKTSTCETSDIASLVSSSQLNMLQNKTSSHESSNASILNNDQPNVLHKSDIHSLVSSAQPNVLHKASDFSSLSSVHTNAKCVALQNNSVTNNSQEGNSKSLIVDLVESDNECDSSFSIIPKIVMISSQNDTQSNSEESDIELVDVILPDSPVSAAHSDKNIGHKNAGCAKNSSELGIKTEKVDETTHSNANLQNFKLHTSLINKNEVAYTTDICKKSEFEDKFRMEQLKVKKEPDGDECEIILDTTSTNLSKVPLQCNTNIKVEKGYETVKQLIANNSPISTRESAGVEKAKDLLGLNKKIKKERSDGDECEVILDTTTTANFPANLLNKQIHNSGIIKVERDCKAVKQTMAIHGGPIVTRESSKLAEKEQKLLEIPYKNKIVQPLENEMINDLNPFNIKALLEHLKQEFATYQEILTTEQSVETTFKLLEKCQAERLKSLRTQILQCLESAPSNSDSNSFKIAVSKLLDSPELSSPSLKDCEVSSTSDISMQDLKTLANMNLVPLSSISEKDIKPNLSELQRAVKQEPSSSYEINSMSFGEKCIVCAKDASAACQQCAKVFFCSNDCGRKYWEDGHKNVCIK